MSASKASVRLPGFMNLIPIGVYIMFAKYCHLSVIHLNVTTVYFHPGVSVSPQTTSCYVLIKVFAKREERGETGGT